MNPSTLSSPLSYSTPIAQIPFVYLDVETTGMEPEMGDRICELGMIKAVNGEMLTEFQELIHPGRKISAEASAVNKITDAMVAGKPYFKQLAPRIREFIDNTVLVIHNAPFDMGFLAVQFGVLGYPRLNHPVIDSLKLARKFYRFPGNRLGDIGRAFKINADGYHRASADIAVLKQIFEIFLIDFQNSGARTLEDLLLLQDGSIPVPEPTDYPMPPVMLQAFRDKLELRIEYTHTNGDTIKELIEPLDILQHNSKGLHLIAYDKVSKSHHAIALKRVIKIELNQ